jgi:hypothetical protein
MSIFFRFLLTLLILPNSLHLFSQQIAPDNGAPESKITKTALTNAKIVLDKGEILNNGVILIEDKRVVRVGENVKIPDGFMIRDMHGSYVLASFIELSSTDGVGSEKNDQTKRSNFPQFLSNKIGPYYWNESINSEFSALEHYDFAEKHIALQKMGFGFVVPHNPNGVARGTAPIIAVGSVNPSDAVVQNHIAAFLSLDKGHSRQTYPSSQMGVIALLRQAFIDALWFDANDNLTFNHSLNALSKQMQGKFIFEVQDKLEVQRAVKILNEFG